MPARSNRAGVGLALLGGLVAQGRASHARGRGALGRRVYLHHVRKTGGTSVTSAMLSLGGEPPDRVEARIAGHRPRYTVTGGLVVAAHDRLALQTGWFDYGWSHVPAWRLRLPPSIYTVSVLRDPMARTLSLYRYLRTPTSDDGHVFGAPADERALASGSLGEFVAQLPRTQLLNQLYTFSETLDVDEAVTRLERCDLVFLTEGMAQGVERLGEVIGRPLSVRVERRSGASPGPTDAEVELLRDLLAPEYELLSAVRPLVERHGAAG